MVSSRHAITSIGGMYILKQNSKELVLSESIFLLNVSLFVVLSLEFLCSCRVCIHIREMYIFKQNSKELVIGTNRIHILGVFHILWVVPI